MLLSKVLTIESLKNSIAELIKDKCRTATKFYEIINSLDNDYFRAELLVAQSVIEGSGLEFFYNSNGAVARGIRASIEAQAA